MSSKIDEIDDEIKQAAKAVYRKYGANLAAFWRDAFAAEAQRHGRAEVETYNVDGNCIHCIPICRRCQLSTIEAHLREKEQIRATASTETSERCDVSVTGKHRIDAPYCKDCGNSFPPSAAEQVTEQKGERRAEDFLCRKPKGHEESCENTRENKRRLR